MSSSNDIKIIHSQPDIKIWGNQLDDFHEIKSYRGKFVVSEDDQLFIRLVPTTEWDKDVFFHDQVVRELGVNSPTSIEMHEVIPGGGKINVDLVHEHVEVYLHGKSTIYGDYDPDSIDQEALEDELCEALDLDDLPIVIKMDNEI